MLMKFECWYRLLLIAVVVCCLLIPLGCSSTTPQDSIEEQGLPDFCSMEALLATPERYDGRWVQVVGYARVEFEYQVLFPLKEYDEFGIVYSTISLRFDDSLIDIENRGAYDRSYVFLEGTFDASDHGNGLSQGTIHQITSIDIRNPVHAEEDNDEPRQGPTAKGNVD